MGVHLTELGCGQNSRKDQRMMFAFVSSCRYREGTVYTIKYLVFFRLANNDTY